jgi:hypothetical protein
MGYTGVMACLGTLAPGQEFLVLVGYAAFVMQGASSLGDEKHLVSECPHLQPIRDRYPGVFRVSTMIQFF